MTFSTHPHIFNVGWFWHFPIALQWNVSFFTTKFQYYIRLLLIVFCLQVSLALQRSFLLDKKSLCCSITFLETFFFNFTSYLTKTHTRQERDRRVLRSSSLASPATRATVHSKLSRITGKMFTPKSNKFIHARFVHVRSCRRRCWNRNDSG